MTPEQQIDDNIDKILKASGSALKNYSVQKNIHEMREVMREIMSKSYIAGSDAMADTLGVKF